MASDRLLSRFLKWVRSVGWGHVAAFMRPTYLTDEYVRCNFTVSEKTAPGIYCAVRKVRGSVFRTSVAVT